MTNNQPSNSPPKPFDVFLSHKNDDKPSVEQLAIRLAEEEKFEVWLDKWNLIPGEPWQEGLEEALDQSRTCAVFLGPSGFGGWHHEEMRAALDQRVADRTRKFRVIPVLLPGATMPDRSKLPAFLSRLTWVDFRQGLDDAEAFRRLVAGIRGIAPGRTEDSSTPINNVECPYLGLEAFTEDKSHLFFGRDNFIEAIWQKLHTRQFLAVVGPSGSGKSSVVQAGVFPRLDGEWRKLVFQPGDDPFLNLADKFVEVRGARYRHFSERSKAVEAVAQQIKDSRSIAAMVTETLAALPPPSRLLLVADQFEELFTLTPTADRQPFVEALLAASHLEELKVLVTLRADFFGQAISLTPELSQLIQDGVVTHRPLQRADWEAIILDPAKTVGLHVDPALVALILEEIEAQPDSLPLLEYALKELWQRCEQGRIGHPQYEAIGKLAGAINQRADAVLAQLPAEQQPLALRALTRLVRVSGSEEEGADTRLRLPLNELTEEQGDVLQSFINERLLVTNRHDRTGEETIEVTHEALIRRWEKLREALDSDREFLVWRRRLNVRRNLWEQKWRDDKWLLAGGDNEDAQRWLAERGTELNQPETEFITWMERPIYQAERTLVVAQGVFPLAKKKVQKRWLAALVYVGEKDRALKLIEESDDYTLREEAFGLIAQLIAKLGETTEALNLIETKLSRPDIKALSLSSLAVELARMGEARMALDVADKARDTRPSATILHKIAAALAKEGLKEKALEIAFRSEKSQENFFALSLVAKSLARGGFTADAVAIAREIQVVRERDAVLNAVAVAQARAKQVDNALGIAKEIVDLEIREHTFCLVAEALAGNGIQKGALTAVQQISDWNRRQGALNRVERELEKVGGVVTSLLTLSAVESALQELWAAYDRARELIEYANIFLDQENFDNAQKLIIEVQPIINRINNEEERSNVVRKLSVTLVRLRDYRNAREQAEKFCLSSDRLTVYTAILREYHIERNPSLAQLFAQETADAEIED